VSTYLPDAGGWVCADTYGRYRIDTVDNGNFVKRIDCQNGVLKSLCQVRPTVVWVSDQWSWWNDKSNPAVDPRNHIDERNGPYLPRTRIGSGRADNYADRPFDHIVNDTELPRGAVALIIEFVATNHRQPRSGSEQS
jgi:hypothetical protein